MQPDRTTNPWAFNPGHGAVNSNWPPFWSYLLLPSWSMASMKARRPSLLGFENRRLLRPFNNIFRFGFILPFLSLEWWSTRRRDDVDSDKSSVAPESKAKSEAKHCTQTRMRNRKVRSKESSYKRMRYKSRWREWCGIVVARTARRM
jgi:hypothetical protein